MTPPTSSAARQLPEEPVSNGGEMTALLHALNALRNGEPLVRLPAEWVGVAGKVADAFNEVVLKHEFAVILLDVNMPGMSGFEIASLIRNRKKSAHTCNGNGDGKIDWPGESMLAWQQLALGGLIPGSYAGTAPTLTAMAFGVNEPASHISNVGYSIGYLEYAGDPPGGGYALPDTPDANRITVGLAYNNGPWPGGPPLLASFMTDDEGYQMDVKIDNGRPASGNMTILPQGQSQQATFAGTCAVIGATAIDPNTRYAALVGYHTGIFCTPIFLLGM